MARFIDSGFVLLSWLEDLPIAAIRLARGGSASHDLVSQQSDGERVEIRAIIIEDRPVISREQIGRRTGTVRLDQARNVRFREPVAVGNDPEGAPLADGEPTAVP